MNVASEFVDTKLGRDGVEILSERCMQVQALRQFARMNIAAALARNAHGLVLRQRFRCTQLRKNARGTLGDDIGIAEGPKIDRGDELAGVGRAFGIVGEVDDIAAEGGTVEHAGEQADRDAEAIALRDRR